MICTMIMLGAISINPCDIDRLNMSFNEPDARCYVKMNDGTQHNIKQPCTEIFKKIHINPEPEIKSNEIEWTI